MINSLHGLLVERQIAPNEFSMDESEIRNVAWHLVGSDQLATANRLKR